MQRTLRVSAMTAAISLVASAAGQSCTADIVRDGRVDGADLGTMLSYWGPRTSAQFSIASDINGDATIDGFDLGILLANWGNCSAPSWCTVIEIEPDPTVVSDPALRSAIAITGLPWRVRDNGTGIEMLLIPPGQFQMGCQTASSAYPCLSNEQPVHPVTLTRPYYLARYEVTQAQWTATMGSNPSYFQGASDAASRPVERVSWDTIQGFLSTTGLRLPTSAEWERACRGGTQTPYYNGSAADESLGLLAWYYANSNAQTHAVGGKQPNPFGMYDMLGNVFEWVSDWWGPYAADPVTDPVGADSGTSRVLRGGCYSNEITRSSYRGGFQPMFGDPNIGFRVARDP